MLKSNHKCTKVAQYAALFIAIFGL